jgi:hypothetical protein
MLAMLGIVVMVVALLLTPLGVPGLWIMVAVLAVGMPVPVFGSVIAGFVGSFAGAALATLYETRRVEAAARVGWGTLLGRMWAAAAKVAAGTIILVLGSASLLL